MFVSEKLVFLELHKTGGSHIRRLLAEVVGGEKEGKHNRLNPAYKNRFIVGSVRNPWDWYVSLWAFGCGGKGSVHLQCVDGPSWYYYRHNLRDEMGLSGFSVETLWAIYQQYQNDRKKDRDFWHYCYEDADDPKRFQTWLNRVMNPQYALDLREGYGFSPISTHTGLLGYRYLKLFTDLDDDLYNDACLGDAAKLGVLLEQRKLVDFVIRNEHMEEDFIACLGAANIALNDQQLQKIHVGKEQKTNTSERRAMAYYYDPQSIGLIAEKEQLIVATHGYQPPALS